jgi:mRNA interferase RelE/StbE
MNYRLKFLPTALKQWGKLDNSVKKPLYQKLRAVLAKSHVSKNKLRNYDKLYKIKQRSSGYRLVYKVEDSVITVTVITIGKREKGEVYKKLSYLK